MRTRLDCDGNHPAVAEAFQACFPASDSDKHSPTCVQNKLPFEVNERSSGDAVRLFTRVISPLGKVGYVHAPPLLLKAE
jgi:hypothetical protein